jgi:hypothetical protein
MGLTNMGISTDSLVGRCNLEGDLVCNQTKLQLDVHFKKQITNPNIKLNHSVAKKVLKHLEEVCAAKHAFESQDGAVWKRWCLLDSVVSSPLGADKFTRQVLACNRSICDLLQWCQTLIYQNTYLCTLNP